jgi:hypothetical protein
MKPIRSMVRIGLGFVSLMALAGTMKAGPPVTWYFSPSGGNDTTGKGTLAQPFKTGQKAVNASKTGDRIVDIGFGDMGPINVPHSLTITALPTVDAYIIGPATGPAINLATGGPYKVQNLKLFCPSTTGTTGIQGNLSEVSVNHAVIKNCNVGISNAAGTLTLKNSVVEGNTTGVNASGTGLFYFDKISWNTSDGIDANGQFVAENTVLEANGQFGISVSGLSVVEAIGDTFVANHIAVNSAGPTSHINLGRSHIAGSFLGVQGPAVGTYGDNYFSANQNDGTIPLTVAKK